MTNDRQRLRAITSGPLTVNTTVELALRYTVGHLGFRPGGNLWLFYDIRQYTQQRAQHLLPDDGLVVKGPAGTTWTGAMLADGKVVRTLDTIPQLPEFLYGLHVTCTGRALRPGEAVTIQLRSQPEGFALPQNAIEAFHFWLVEDPSGALRFEHAPGEKYHYYHPRDVQLSVLQSNPLTIAAGAATNIRVHCPSLSTGRATARLRAEDAYGNPARLPNRPLTGQSCTDGARCGAALGLPLTVASSVERKTLPSLAGSGQDVELAIGGAFDTVTVTSQSSYRSRSNPVRVSDTPAQPQLFWGELHGMAFNQRPYREYFEWAKEVACLDFAAGEYFSYNACVQETWDTLLQVWDAFEQPGTFISLPAVEYGTPPDISHRIAFYPSTRGLPPILCEERKAAHDPNLTARYSPETIFCTDYRALYDLVRRHNGLLHGHFHTQFYAGEDLAEIYQKQPSDLEAEERKINRALQAGLKLGIVGGSDTHDSRPTNPFPEPGPVRPAGITGVWADRLDRPSLFAALRQRRCYATTGGRMLVDFRVNGRLMGATVRADRYRLRVEALGTADISRIELLENGVVRRSFEPRRQHAIVEDEWPAPADHPPGVHYCYARIFQADGERAWTSPIWLTASP